MRTSTALSLFAIAVVCRSVSGQYVISAQSGLLDYFEGNVSVDSLPLSPLHGRFQQLSSGSIVSTSNGRAEVLLTPRAYMWIDENSAIRVVSNQLTNAVVEVLHGSVMVGSGENSLDDSLTVMYQKRSVRVPEQGFYRIDCEPFLLRVNRGSVELSGFGDPVVVSSGSLLNVSLQSDPTAGKCRDAFDVWAVHRAKVVRIFSRADSRSLTASNRHHAARIFPRAHAATPERTW